MTDQEQEQAELVKLLERTIDATQDPERPGKRISDRAFARDVLGMNERSLRRMLAGQRKIMPRTALIIRQAMEKAETAKAFRVKVLAESLGEDAAEPAAAGVE